MELRYNLNEQVYAVSPIQQRDDIIISIDGHCVDARLNWINTHQCQLSVNGIERTVYVAQDDDQLYIHLDGKVWQLSVLDEFSDTGATAAPNSGLIKAPMPGIVVDVSVSIGSHVEIGESLLLIESMKMQTEITAKVAGTVSHIASVGENFNKGTELVVIALADAQELSQ